MHRHTSIPKHERHHRPDEGGFTLVEMVVMLAIVAMAALIAIPNLQRVRVKIQSQQAIRKITGYVDMARSEAIKRHSPIGIVYGDSSVPADNFFRLFEDWDPNNTAVGTNGDGALNGNEEVFYTRSLDGKLTRLTSSPAGDTDPKSLVLQPGSGLFYGSDGSLTSSAGAAYYEDEFGNTFRVRINSVTGAARIDMMLPNKTWSSKKEDWKWNY